MSKEWTEEILERLDRGSAATEAEVRRLIKERRDDRETIRVLTDAAIDFLHTWVEATNHAGQFDDHAGQFIDK